tara:strand:- start:452 stop:973 length:522 start_codon:yes stop_codon:yes gene_type:complete
MSDQLWLTIRNALHDANDNIKAGTSIDRGKSCFWTRSIKKELCSAGRKSSFYTCASEVDGCAHNGEWLYDVSWVSYGKNGFQEDPEKRSFEKVVLAVESEWAVSKSAALDDFEKLLQTRADMRLMIFEIKSKDYFDKRLKFLRKKIISCIPEELEQYRFAGFYEDSAKGLEFC